MLNLPTCTRRWSNENAIRCLPAGFTPSSTHVPWRHVTADDCRVCQAPERPAPFDLEKTLPPYVAGRDRRVHFESDGTIVYETEAGWEPPKPIDGYQQDPNDPLRLKPLWPACVFRQGTALRLTGCGCVGVLMHCRNPACPQFTSFVKCEACTVCPWRKE